MINTLRNSSFFRLIWCLLALHLINISIDSPDLQPSNIPEDLTFNDQESIVEFVIETLLGFENAIAEYDDPDTEKQNTSNKMHIDWIALNAAFNFKVGSNYGISKLHIPLYIEHASKEFCTVFSPPPEV